MNLTEKLIGHVGVDAGCVMIGDPCYVIPGGGGKTPQWDDVVNTLFDEKGHDREGIDGTSAHEFEGVLITGTPDGDGKFPVYAEVDEDGQIYGLRIELASPEERNPDAHCSNCGEEYERGSLRYCANCEDDPDDEPDD